MKRDKHIWEDYWRGDEDHSWWKQPAPEVMEFIASLSRDAYVNVMAQYRPCYRAGDFPPLDRRLTTREYEEAVEATLAAGLHRLDERPLWLLRDRRN